MKRLARFIFKALALISAVVLVAAIVVVGIALYDAINPRSKVHVTGYVDQIVVHNQEYPIGTVLLGIAGGPPQWFDRGLHREFAGVQIDYFATSPIGRWWTIYVSIWWLIPGLFPGLAWIAMFLKRRRHIARFFERQRQRRTAFCVHCDYDLRATPDRCPECGEFVSDDPRSRGEILISNSLRVSGYVLVFYLCCLAMMAIHELGHVFHAWLSGGRVEHVELGLLEFSRTDLSFNPHAQFVAWGGPLWGSAIPLIAYGITVMAKSRFRKFVCFFAGFCLIANGGYIGLGWVDGVGDAGTLLRHGAPTWSLIVSGWIALLGGMLVWHQLGPRLGLAKAKPANSLEQSPARG